MRMGGYHNRENKKTYNVYCKDCIEYHSWEGCAEDTINFHLYKQRWIRDYGCRVANQLCRVAYFFHLKEPTLYEELEEMYKTHPGCVKKILRMLNEDVWEKSCSNSICRKFITKCYEVIGRYVLYPTVEVEGQTYMIKKTLRKSNTINSTIFDEYIRTYPHTKFCILDRKRNKIVKEMSVRQLLLDMINNDPVLKDGAFETKICV